MAVDSGPSRHRGPTPGLLLALVCALHGLSSLTLVGLHHGFGWDETVYLSQINRFVPAGIWSPPRARGLTLLVAPVTLTTSSLAAIRVWLALLTSVLMFLGFRPWMRLVRPAAVPLAALLFSALWQTIYYGAEAMPNLFVACFAVAAAAAAVLYLREPRGWSRLLWLALSVAAIALIRPSDAVYAAVPLAAFALVAGGRAWRPRLLVVGTVLTGLVAGVAQWVVEAYVSFGGPVERYHRAIAEQGSSGLQFSLGLHARSLAGPMLCRDGCDPHPSWWVMAWWFALPLLVVVGFALSRRGQRLPLAAAVVTALAMAAEYVLGIAYAAPRFLLPTYALLFIVVAVALVEAVARVRVASARAVVAAAVGLVVLAQVVSQSVILRSDALPPDTKGLAIWDARSQLLRNDVLKPGRCAVAGPSSPPVAYRAGCRSVSMTTMGLGRFSPSTQRVVLSDRRIDTSGTWLQPWQEYRVRVSVPSGPADRVYVYLPPGEQPRRPLVRG